MTYFYVVSFLHALYFAAHVVKADTASSATGSHSRVHEGLEILDKFCSQDLGTKDTGGNIIVDCSCCATSHLSGDIGEQVALQYGGHLTIAKAVEAGQAVGEVPAWSLGNFVPQVICHNDNLLMCVCEGKGNKKLDEPACKTGSACKIGDVPQELSDQSSAGKEDTKQVPKDHGRDSCTFIARPASAQFQKRVPLGSARCEDVNPKQCNLFYAKKSGESGDSWHHCESIISPKQCKAKVTKEDVVRERSIGIDAWGAKHAFVPGAWPVDIAADGTVTVDKHPPIEVFEKYADNLPPRTLEAYKI